jgi:nicotinamidase-related amidase
MTLNLPCRYYRVYTDAGVACVESNFRHVERMLPIPAEQAALVLVDIWSTHYIDSWFERASEVTRKQIVPVVDAARRIGMLVVHAPSPSVSKKYGAVATPAAPRSRRKWPPDSFRGMYRGAEYAAFGRDREPRLQQALARYGTELDIAEPARPLSGEPVIAAGDDLQTLLEQRRILHLFYAGFATNWCVMFRDYGVLAMDRAGYNIILVRDATTGVEFHDTVADLTATQIAIREIETKHGWSTASSAFIAACEALRG